MRLLLPLATVLGLTCPPLAAAQESGVLRLDSATLAALAPFQTRIERAEVVRLRTATGTSIIAAPRLIAGGLAYGQMSGPEPSLERFELQRRGGSAARGAKVGAVVLGVAGVAMGVVASGLACLDAEGRCDVPWIQGGLAVGAIGAGTGALLGALIGALSPGWRTIVRYPPPPPMFF